MIFRGHLRETEEREDIISSDCIRESTCWINALDVGDPRSGISLSKRPRDKRADRSNQKEPKQASRSMSEGHS